VASESKTSKWALFIFDLAIAERAARELSDQDHDGDRHD
jgi:hypothetical protein